MITICICLIYYGIALWLYQVYGWVSAGEWAPYPVLTAWPALFGSPAYKLGPVAWWLLELPLSLVLLTVGFGHRRLGIRPPPFRPGPPEPTTAQMGRGLVQGKRPSSLGHPRSGR